MYRIEGEGVVEDSDGAIIELSVSSRVCEFVFPKKEALRRGEASTANTIHELQADKTSQGSHFIDHKCQSASISAKNLQRWYGSAHID